MFLSHTEIFLTQRINFLVSHREYNVFVSHRDFSHTENKFSSLTQRPSHTENINIFVSHRDFSHTENKFSCPTQRPSHTENINVFPVNKLTVNEINTRGETRAPNVQHTERCKHVYKESHKRN